MRQATSPNTIDFFSRNVKRHPGKTSIKFNIIQSKDNLKLSLPTMKKDVTMKDEIVHCWEENKEVDVQVAA